MANTAPGDDAFRLACQLAAAYTAGRMEESVARTLAATFPSATFARQVQRSGLHSPPQSSHKTVKAVFLRIWLLML